MDWFVSGLRAIKRRIFRTIESLNPWFWILGVRPSSGSRVEHIWPPSNFSKRSSVLWRLVDYPLAVAGVFKPHYPRAEGSHFATFHNEHLVIADALQRTTFDSPSYFFVDIGSGDGVDMSNTFLLAEQGVDGIALEFNPSKFAMMSVSYRALPKVQLARVPVTPLNVVSLLEGLGCPEEPTILNLDIDSYDYDVLAVLLKRYRFPLLCLEINPIFPLEIQFKVNFPSAEWSGDLFQGMSLSLASQLLRDNGYKISHIDRAFLFAVRADHASGFDVPTSDEELQRMLDESLKGSNWDYVLANFRDRPTEEIFAAFELLFAKKPQDAFSLTFAP